MSRAYKNRKKNREIGDLTYPSGGGRISRNAFLAQVKRTRKKLRAEGQEVPSKDLADYGKFVEMGNSIVKGE